ncbi:DUF6660 family protein [Spirosoma sp. 48-14]|uniref:DUF6660 family protein n=2 Tax=unclassified Spirosoma TaxID=2621999 RepID=UPI00345B55CB
MNSMLHGFLCAYMLFLSVLPCADSFGLLRSDKQSASISADNHQHLPHQATGDNCSPLCVCSCCGTVLEALPQFAFGFISLQPFQTACFAPVSTLWLSPSLSSWQPPLLG